MLQDVGKNEYTHIYMTESEGKYSVHIYYERVNENTWHERANEYI